MTTKMPETLRAGHLCLTRATPADADAVIDAVQASVPEIQPWMPWAHSGYGRTDGNDWTSRTWLAWSEGRAYEFCIWDAEQLVGVMGLNAIRGHQANLGFWMRSDRAGQGLCTLAAARLARAGLEEVGLGRIYLRHMLDNHGSRRVAEKVGFILEGRIRNAIEHHGELVDMMQHSLISADEIQIATRPHSP